MACGAGAHRSGALLGPDRVGATSAASSSGIAAAGPAILVSYALVGLLVVFVMRMLGEMAAASPNSGSFSAYADRVLGRWAGFSIGWLYWFFWVVVLAVEATAGTAILESWIPAVPQWGWALIVMVVLTATNLASVASCGAFEFWFAGIKVVAIGAFVVISLLAVFGEKMWLFPYLTWATAAVITFVLGYMVYDDANRQVALLSVLVAAIVVSIVVVLDVLRKRKAAAAPVSG